MSGLSLFEITLRPANITTRGLWAQFASVSYREPTQEVLLRPNEYIVRIRALPIRRHSVKVRVALKVVMTNIGIAPMIMMIRIDASRQDVCACF